MNFNLTRIYSFKIRTIIITIGIFSLSLFLLTACSDKKFNSEKWKTSTGEQFYMLNDIVENKRFLEKSKNEIIELLDSTYIKQFKYSNNSWMFVISIPTPTSSTESGIKVLDINFENEIVKQVKIR